MQQEQLTGTATPVRTALGGAYESTYSYDANGNLDKLSRWAANEAGVKTQIDDFTYHYTAGTNQLTHVADALGTVLDDDLANQTANNYEYDEIGQLVKDNQEDIARIEWKVTGKVHKIIRTEGSTKPNLEFVYDAMGNRIQKIITNNSGEILNKTYYIRDAQGNTMSVYTYTPETVEGYDDNQLQLTERSIYGSSRLGVEEVNQIIAAEDPGYININDENGIYNGIDNRFVQRTGDKRYELSNHLGNVLEVVTDRKLAVNDGTGSVDYYVADVVLQSDYFPFGMITASDDAGSQYKYAFNGMEKDDEVAGEANSYDFGARFYNPRVGRWQALDPLAAKYPSLSPYNYTLDNPILFIDPDGKDVIIKDVASLKALLGTLTADEIKRINIYQNGVLTITGSESGSKNLENLRILVDSKLKHNFVTTDTYESADGLQRLGSNTGGRTVLLEEEGNDLGLSDAHVSGDGEVYVIIKPTTESGAVEVLAHEAFGHAVLAEKLRNGEDVDPLHDFGPDGERNEDFKKQGWGATTESRKNYKANVQDKDWLKSVDQKVEDYEANEPKQVGKDKGQPLQSRRSESSSGAE